jgi:hypothetical protein
VLQIKWTAKNGVQMKCKQCDNDAKLDSRKQPTIEQNVLKLNAQCYPLIVQNNCATCCPWKTTMVLSSSQLGCYYYPPLRSSEKVRKCETLSSVPAKANVSGQYETCYCEANLAMNVLMQSKCCKTEVPETDCKC